MSIRLRACSAAVCLIATAVIFGQNVDFQIAAFPGTTVNPGTPGTTINPGTPGTTVNPGTSGTAANPGSNPVVVVQPGTVIPFAVLASVNSNQTPTGGLAGFDLGINTNLGVAQSGFTFGPASSPIFTVNRSVGTVSTDDVLGIAGAQPIGATVGTATNFALNTRQVIGTGQLVTPNTVGTFTVDLAGNAVVFSTTGSTVATVPANTTSTGLTIVTQSATGTPTTVAQNSPSSQPSIEGGASGPEGPQSDGQGEQVAGEIPEGPTLTSTIGGGFCGAGAVSAAFFSLLGLGLMAIFGCEWAPAPRTRRMR